MALEKFVALTSTNFPVAGATPIILCSQTLAMWKVIVVLGGRVHMVHGSML